MNIIKNIVSYILTIILVIAIVMIIVINIAENTVLSEEYTLSKFEETDYFSEIYDEAISYFEGYLEQSGLEDFDVSDIISVDKVQDDTEIIIDNIYNGTETEIDTAELENNFNAKIDEWLEDKELLVDQDALDQLIEVICTEYEDALTHTKYETKIYSYIEKINSYMSMAKTATITAIVVSAILIALINIKTFGKAIAKYGIALTSSGLLFIIANKYVYYNVKVNNLTIFNDAFSKVLRNILNDVLGKVLNAGIICCVCGVIAIVVSAIITSKNVKEKAKANAE